ncbi:MAG: energy coupling factor transporter S component ThiW [Lachnospiraceae bacterium]|jgi:energy coupling factor transporter S component ThiW|nr:energy coupling factor transporter S component ThiW [Lachnospiraceae bacterium]
MKTLNTKKLAISGAFCAVAVVGSLFSFPVFGSKCSPVQHMVNILCAILLGPGYGLLAAFAAAWIRNLLGLGSMMAFPGSMFGALVCGLAYWKYKSIFAALIGEVFGTAVLGGLCAYPVAVFIMGQNASQIPVYAYIFPFLISTAAGAVCSAVVLYSLKQSKALHSMQEILEQ